MKKSRRRQNHLTNDSEQDRRPFRREERKLENQIFERRKSTQLRKQRSWLARTWRRFSKPKFGNLIKTSYWPSISFPGTKRQSPFLQIRRRNMTSNSFYLYKASNNFNFNFYHSCTLVSSNQIKYTLYTLFYFILPSRKIKKFLKNKNESFKTLNT